MLGKIGKRIYKFLGWSVIAFATLLLCIRVAVMHWLPTAQLKEAMQTMLPFPVEFENIEMRWNSLHPSIRLTGIQIKTSGEPITAQEVKIVLRIWPLFFKRLELDKLILEKAHLYIWAQKDGMVGIAGLPYEMNLKSKGNAKTARFIKELQINKSKINLLWQGQNLALEDFDLAASGLMTVKIRADGKIAGEQNHFELALDVPTIGSKATHCYFELKGDSPTLNRILPMAYKLQSPQMHLQAWGNYHRETWDMFVNFQMPTYQINYAPKQMHLTGEHLKGQLFVSPQKSNLTLHADQLVVDYPQVLSHFLPISSLDTKMHWENNELDMEQLAFVLQEMPVNGQGTLHFEPNQKYPELEFQFETGAMLIQDLLHYFPNKLMDKDLTAWLNKSIKGHLKEAQGVFRGNLADFPFKENEGVFEIMAQIDHAELDYLSPWPKIEGLSADLKFHNAALYIDVNDGQIAKGQLFDLDAVIPNLGSKRPLLIVDGKVISTLESGEKIIQASPLKTIANALDPIALKGDMKLSIGLEVPLSSHDETPVKVRGVIETQNAQAALKSSDIAIQSLQGMVSFTEDTLRADNLNGQFMNTPIALKIQHSDDAAHAIEIKATGHLSVKDFEKIAKSEPQAFVHGQTDFAAVVRMAQNEHDHSTFTLTSDLKGVGIDLPAPFSKPIEAIRPLEVSVYFENNELMRVAAKLGEAIQANYSLQKQNEWQSVGGHLHFGENRTAKFREDMIFLVDGDIPEISLDAFKTMSSANNWTFKLEPLIALDFGNITYNGLTFSKQKVEAQWDSTVKQWNIELKGPQLAGNLVLPQGEDDRDIAIHLQKLVLDKKAFNQSESLKEKPSRHPLDIQIAEFKAGDKSFTDLRMRLLPGEKGYTIPFLKAKYADSQANLSASWDYLDTPAKVNIQGDVKSKNVNEILQLFSLGDSIKKAKGQIQFNLDWEGQPFEVNKSALKGFAEISFTKGNIEGVNPGIGRILNLLNINNVQRRLSLDFQDVTKNNFSFNELTAKLQFGKGKVSANNVVLNGPSAKITAFGQADLNNQGLDAEMVVMPNVTGSLPVVAAISAGNPAVGAAVWLADKVFGKHIQQIHRLHYKVAGTLKSPNIEEVPSMRIGRAR